MGSRRAPLAALLALLGMQAACSPTQPPSPDLVIVTLDTTRVDHLSTYGYSRETDPHLAALAAESVRYTRAWSTSPWTLPAHGSLFTGLYPPSHGAHAGARGANLAEVLTERAAHFGIAGKLPEQHLTLAEILSERGYRTGAFVGGPWLSGRFGLLQGFEHRVDAIEDRAGTPADVLTDAAIEWLDGLSPGAPSFLFVNYFDAHAPFEPPPGFDDLPLARDPFELDGPTTSRLLTGEQTLADHERRVLIDRYDGEIRYVDHHLGRLLAAVAARPRGERALVIVTADHGEAFGEGDRWFHTYWLSDELLRIPLVIRYPDRRGAGTSDATPVQLVDLLPLVATQLGFEPPEGIEGSWAEPRRHAYAQLYRHALGLKISRERFDRALEAVIDWPLKLVRSDRGESELVSIEESPERPAESADDVARLSALLDRAAAGWVPVEGEAPALDDATRRALQNLGYVE